MKDRNPVAELRSGSDAPDATATAALPSWRFPGRRLRLDLGTSPDALTFVLVAAVGNVLLYHWPLFSFSVRHLHLDNFTGAATQALVIITLLCISVITLAAVALVSHRALGPFSILIALGNAIALYFMDTYHVMLDKTTMGNVLDTDWAESSAYVHSGLLLQLLIFGLLPAWLIARTRIRPTPRPRLAAVLLSAAATTFVFGMAGQRTWLWFDQYSSQVGGMILPWSYAANAGRFLAPRLLPTDPPQPLPAASFSSQERTVVVLVIGEAARADNFQLYGYHRPTNPLLSQRSVVALRDTKSCATYTTAAIRCILSSRHGGSAASGRFELLPSYLRSNGVDVIWRSNNGGEPRLNVSSYQSAGDLRADCVGGDCHFDEVLLTGLQQQIRQSRSKRVFVVLHELGSHGPDYYNRYPPGMEQFRPVCRSVELSQCSDGALVNTYDDTVLYQDHLLARVIDLLQGLGDTASLLIYVSDHGESLGEFGFYLHGLPDAMAPAVQKRIPFLLWMSDRFMRDKAIQPDRLLAQQRHSQFDVFHSVMSAFSMHSAAYDESHDIFSERFANQ